MVPCLGSRPKLAAPEDLPIELSLLALVPIAALTGWALIRPHRTGPVGLWLASCGGIYGAGACNLLAERLPWILPLRSVMAALFYALLLAGALAYARRPVPRWVAPLFMGIGGLREVALAAGWPLAAMGIALSFEVPAVIAAGWLVHRVAREESATRTQRSLAPAMVVLGALTVATVVVTKPGGPLPPGFLEAWFVGVPFLLALQIAALSDQTQAALRRTRDGLEVRVAERTVELESSLRALGESEERHRTVSELSSDYSFGVRLTPDLSVAFDWLSKPVPEFAGFRERFIEGRLWLERFPPEERESVLEGLRAVMAGEIDDMELNFLTLSGEPRWAAVRFGARHRDADGTVHLVGAGRDITALRRAEQERQRLDAIVRERERVASLGLLAGGIAHDFNNVLTVIRGNTRLALDEIGPGQPARARLARIQTTAEYASELTEQMLAYSGKASVTLRTVDLSHLVRDALDLMRASLAEKSQLDVHLADGLPSIRADFTQLRQVLLNLVGNASEATLPEGGRIEVRTGSCHLDAEDLADAFTTPDPEPGDYVYLEIGDDGPGIDEQVKSHIFEPFFTTKASGRGLGLAAVFGIVTAHRGIVQIDGAPGRGTIVRALFPVAQAAEEPAPSPDVAADAPRAGTILVVDDDEWVLELAAEFLTRDGFEVMTARGGHAAVEQLRAHPEAVAAVVLDLVMPEMSGEETLLAMREIRPDLPAVLASGYDSATSAERLASQGVVRFVQKPYAPEDLTGRVRDALGQGTDR